MSCLCYWLRANIYIYQVIRIYLFAITITLCVQLQIAYAGSLDEVIVFEKDGIYHVNITAEIAATEEHVRQVLTDYAHVYRLNDSVIESKVLEPTIDGKVQVQSLLLSCTTLFCREVMRVDEISELESGDLQAVIIPEQSDFRSGTAVWEIVSMGDSTRLTYLASIEPDFFIPPVLGTQTVINNMRDEFITAFYRIERIARINEAREWDEDFAFTHTTQQIEDGPCNLEQITSLQ